MNLRLDEIRVGPRHRKQMGDIPRLAASIAAIGLLHPVVVKPDGLLIAGRRRLEACRSLGWQEIPVTVIDIENVIRGEYDENEVREDFLPSEAVAIAEALEPGEREAAKERQGTRADQHPENFTGSSGIALDKVARVVGMSRPTLTRAREVVEAAERDPERFSTLVEEMDRTGRVNGVYRKLRVAEQTAAINQEPPPLPAGPFRVIVADPPWTYGSRANDPAHRAANPYPSMSLDEIKAFPVADFAADDCILWLWTTNAHLPVAFEVVAAWGFEYKTTLTWVKDKMGTGDWLRGKTEQCLMCIRGKPVVCLTNQTTVLHGPLREHSRKPDEFYEMVEALCPGAKLELFGRTPRQGWNVYGNDPTRFS